MPIRAAPATQSSTSSTPIGLASLGKPISTPLGGAPKSGSGDAFASLLGGAGAKKPTQTKGASMADMARQKASAGIWGAPAVGAPAASGSSAPAAGQGGQQQKVGGGLDDLLG